MDKLLLMMFLLFNVACATDMGIDISSVLHETIGFQSTAILQDTCSLNSTETLVIVIIGSCVKEVIDINTGSYWNSIDIIWGVIGWGMFQLTNIPQNTGLLMNCDSSTINMEDK